MNRVVMVAALALLSACALYDGRGDVRVEVDTSGNWTKPIGVRVVAPGASGAVVMLDGRRLREVELDSWLYVVYRQDIGEGEHVFEALAWRSGVASKSKPVRFTVLPAIWSEAAYAVTPAFGDALRSTADPFRATIALGSPASPDTWRTDLVALRDVRTGAAATATVALADDRLSLEVTATGPLVAFDQGLALELGLRNEAGNPYVAPAPPRWRPGTVPLRFTFPAVDRSTNQASITVTAAPVGDGPGGAATGTLGTQAFTLAPPAWTATVPLPDEGTFQLRLEAAGYLPLTGPRVTVDRTPAQLLCWPAGFPTGDLTFGASIAFSASEPFQIGSLVVTVDGTVASSNLNGNGTIDWYPAERNPGAVVEVSDPLGRDAAGNPILPCTMHVPLWARPLGKPALAPRYFPASLAWFQQEQAWRVAWTSGSELEVGWLSGTQIVSPVTLSQGAIHGLAAASSGPASGTLFWLDSSTAGTHPLLQAYSGSFLAHPAPIDLYQSGDALDPAVDPSQHHVAWAENRPALRRVIYLTDTPAFVPTAIGVLGGGPLTDPADACDHPAPFDTTVAYLRHPDSGPSELRVRRWSGTAWEDLGAVLNADPAAEAGPPTLASANLLAWPEAGSLQVRRWDATTGWSDPVALAPSPGTTVEAVTAAHSRDGVPGVIYLERRGDGSGDVLRFARLGPEPSWQPMVEPASGDFVGSIVWFAVASPDGPSSGPLTVSWMGSFGAQVSQLTE
jgi:hypothetical protein